MASGNPVPPFHGDPELVDHPEGNKYYLEKHRLAVINANRAAEGLPPLPPKRFLDRVLPWRRARASSASGG